MNFRGDLRDLIQGSDLQYLSRTRRREMISGSTDLEVEEINKRISHIFEGYDLQKNGDHTLIGYPQLLLISNICGTYQEIMSLIFNNKADIFLNLDSTVLGKIISFVKTRENFIKFCSDDRIAEILVKEKSGNLNPVLHILEDIEDLFQLLENEDFIYMVTKCKAENIKFILEYLNIDNSEKLKALFMDGKWEHIKKLLKNGTTEEMGELLEINEANNVLISSGIISFNKIWMVGTCDDADKFNKDLLNSALYGDRSFIPIFWNDTIIAYLKMEEYGEESITGIKNVFDENGILVFMKGMIYAPRQDSYEYLGTHYIPSEEGFELSDPGAELSINPIRMVKIDDLDDLINIFVERNGFI